MRKEGGEEGSKGIERNVHSVSASVCVGLEARAKVKA